MFVSSSLGVAEATGSKLNPYASITEAAAANPGKNLYLCGEAFDENVRLRFDSQVYGGLDCGNDWERIETPTTVEPTGAGTFAITVETATVALHDIAFVAPAADATNRSSIGAVFNESDITLERVRIEARAGLNGEDGTSEAAAAATGGNGQDGKYGWCGPVSLPFPTNVKGGSNPSCVGSDGGDAGDGAHTDGQPGGAGGAGGAQGT